ncbi:MAG: ABC transporter permease subunit [Candidatus Dormibacteria bacterium]
MTTALLTVMRNPYGAVAVQALVLAAVWFAGRRTAHLWRRGAGFVGGAAGRVARPVFGNYRVLLVIALVLPLVEQTTGGYLLSVTYNLELYVLLAVGLNIVVGFAGLLDLGYVAFFAVGAYTFALLGSGQLYDLVHRNLMFLVPAYPLMDPGIHVSLFLVLPLAGLVAAGFGVLIGLPTLRLRGDYLAIVTLGFGEITRIFANNLDEPINITNGPRGIYKVDPAFIGNYNFLTEHRLGPVSVMGHQLGPLVISPYINLYFLLLLVVMATVFFASRLETSRVGRAWAAIREDEVAAQVSGINTRNLKLLAYASGGFFGGMAGAIFASAQHFISPESFQLNESILIVSMVVVGGMGSISGVTLGALVVGGITFFTTQLHLDTYRVLVYGALLVIMIAVRPQGLLPSRQRRRELTEPGGQDLGDAGPTALGHSEAPA